ncbi:lipopolysaccharide kinase InaA family protein [Parabacteroides sp.]
MKVVIYPEYSHLANFINRIPEIFEREGNVIYEGRNLIKVFHVDGLALNVKRFRRPEYPNRLVYTFIRPPKAVRAYEYALRLQSKDIDTPTPVAFILCTEGGLLSWSYFVSIQMPDDYQTLYQLGMDPIEGNEDVFRALGVYTARLHQSGVYHKDYSPGNILYRRETDGIKFVLVDINRMSFGSVSLRRGCANFARIWGGAAAFKILAESYADTLHADKGVCTDLVFRYRQRFWVRYAKKHPVKFEL